MNCECGYPWYYDGDNVYCNNCGAALPAEKKNDFFKEVASACYKSEIEKMGSKARIDGKELRDNPFDGQAESIEEKNAWDVGWNEQDSMFTTLQKSQQMRADFDKGLEVFEKMNKLCGDALDEGRQVNQRNQELSNALIVVSKKYAALRDDIRKYNESPSFFAKNMNKLLKLWEKNISLDLTMIDKLILDAVIPADVKKPLQEMIDEATTLLDGKKLYIRPGFPDAIKDRKQIVCVDVQNSFAKEDGKWENLIIKGKWPNHCCQGEDKPAIDTGPIS